MEVWKCVRMSVIKGGSEEVCEDVCEKVRK